MKDSQIAGNPVGALSGSLVQLDGGNITIDNTLVDSLDINGGAGGNGTLALGSDVHVLSTNTPDGVPVTTRSDYTGLSSSPLPRSPPSSRPGRIKTLLQSIRPAVAQRRPR